MVAVRWTRRCRNTDRVAARRMRAMLPGALRWTVRAMMVPSGALSLTAQTVRDSAGVRIIENTRPAWTARERLSLAATPQLVIGDTGDATYRFRRVRGVMRLSDGRIAVVDGGAPSVRFFSADGRYLSAGAELSSTSGRRGNLDFVHRLRGDTIALRSGFGSVALFTSAGAFVRESNLPVASNGRRGPRQFVLALLANGRRIATPLPAPTPRALGARWVDSLELQLLTESGDVEVSLGRLPYLVFEQVASGPMPPWLSAIGAFVGGEDRLYAGFGDRYEIRVFSGKGALESVIRRAWTPVPITPDDWEEWVVEWSKLWVKEQGAARDSAVEAVRGAPYATLLPAFAEFLIDRTGRLWVRGAHWEDAVGAGSYLDLPAVPSQWSVFDVGGRWLGDVEMPRNFAPLEIGADYVAGAARANGITQVAVYVLERGRAP